MSDSTNAERKGFTMSEKNVGKVFEKIFEETPKNRIMVATFSSNIHRIQQVINAAYMYGRKVAIIGRSMVNAVKTASELDYLWIPPRTLIDINETKEIIGMISWLSLRQAARGRQCLPCPVSHPASISRLT